MTHERQHEHHRKEREHEKKEEKRREDAYMNSPWKIHPAWFLALGIVLVLVAIGIWSFAY